MSTDIRNRVQKGVSTGGQFAQESRSEAGITLLPARPLDSLATAKMAGLKARFPAATDGQIEESAAGLRTAKNHGDAAVLAEIERQAGATEHGERFAWDVKNNIVDGGSPITNSYPRDVDLAVRDAVEASGATFANSFHQDGELVINTHGSGPVEASADEDGRLLLRHVGDSEWQGAAEGQSDAELWQQDRARQVDFTSVDRTFGVYAKRGDLEGGLDEGSGEARFKWSNGFDTVEFKSSAGSPLEIHPDTTEEARTAFRMDFTTPHGGEPMERIEKCAATAREMMIWHPDMADSRMKHRDGAIRDVFEARRHKAQVTARIESELPDASVSSGRGAAVVYTSTADWNARAWIQADGTEVFTVNGRQVDGPDPSKRKQVKLAEIMANNRQDLHDLAIASRYSLDG